MSSKTSGASEAKTSRAKEETVEEALQHTTPEEMSLAGSNAPVTDSSQEESSRASVVDQSARKGEPGFDGGDAIALLAGTALASLAAFAIVHHRDSRAKTETHVVPPEVLAAVAQMDAFFKNGEKFSRGMPAFDDIHMWAVILDRNWPSLEDDARKAFYDMPATWDDVRDRWKQLNARQRRQVRANWLPELPLDPNL